MIIYNGVRVLNDLWWDKFGIIKAVDTVTDEVKYYTGTGGGIDREADIKYIIDNGVKYNKEQFTKFYEVLFNTTKGDKNV